MMSANIVPDDNPCLNTQNMLFIIGLIAYNLCLYTWRWFLVRVTILSYNLSLWTQKLLLYILVLYCNNDQQNNKKSFYFLEFWWKIKKKDSLVIPCSRS